MGSNNKRFTSASWGTSAKVSSTSAKKGQTVHGENENGHAGHQTSNNAYRKETSQARPDQEPIKWQKVQEGMSLQPVSSCKIDRASLPEQSASCWACRLPGLHFASPFFSLSEGESGLTDSANLMVSRPTPVSNAFPASRSVSTSRDTEHGNCVSSNATSVTGHSSSTSGGPRCAVDSGIGTSAGTLSLGLPLSQPAQNAAIMRRQSPLVSSLSLSSGSSAKQASKAISMGSTAVGGRGQRPVDGSRALCPHPPQRHPDRLGDVPIACTGSSARGDRIHLRQEVELTNDVQSIMLIMVAVMVGKTVGDYFNHSLFSSLLNLKCIPYLEALPSVVHGKKKVNLELFSAKDVMKKCEIIHLKENIFSIAQMLNNTTYNGFPVVYSPGPGQEEVFLGSITRLELYMLLSNRQIFQSPETSNTSIPLLKYQQVTVEKVPDEGQMNSLLAKYSTDSQYQQLFINLEPYINKSAVTVQSHFSLHRTYAVFRTLGLRHLIVVDLQNRAVGVITRKDLISLQLEKKLIYLDVGKLDSDEELIK
uniref:CBS domain-containing protein n=1 Tax=Leptobrachium leishanense TaxID=445787 RepID=A0A8C5MWG6_9ANUR